MQSSMLGLGRKSRKRRHKERDDKTLALTNAGIRLLALKDYDALSMAKIAREAGVSVGALYARYPDKTAYLYHLIADAFRSMRRDAKLVLDGSRWRRESAAYVAKQIVIHVVAKMTTPRAAGVIRAAVKLATGTPHASDLFEEYRSDVTELAIGLLRPRLRAASPQTIRIAMQIIFATVTDAILQKQPGPMRAGGKRMTEALTNVFLGYLGLSEDGSWAGDEAEDDDSVDEPEVLLPEDEVSEEDAKGRNFDPDLRAYRGRVAKSPEPKRRRKRPEPEAVPKVKAAKPPRAPKQKPKPEPEPARPKRRHRAT
jgi:AcrR family transcriptional regulator